jgi:hypothetical protein
MAGCYNHVICRSQSCVELPSRERGTETIRPIFLMTLRCLTLAACAGPNGTARANNNGGLVSTNLLRLP